jgi:diaminohydroxyphosphoribosylaminopyrimidine deaminase / 5-amino-6-(5-phosphoribosylamino)uracil reductase
MRQALRLASMSLGMTWPNPGVGCVIAKDGQIIGQGRHRICGEEHAEIGALADCRARGFDPAGATVYVSLAPCTKHGRQPPCVLALIAAKVAVVFASVDDPDQEDPWGWFEPAGIAYRVGLCRDLGEHVHGGFLTRMRQGRPRLTGKWAMTVDGCIAAHTGDSKWISDAEGLSLSRRRRRAWDAIVIGHGTAVSDDPLLAASKPRQHGSEPGPVRVVLSSDADLDPGSRLVRSATDQPLLVACSDPPPDMGELLVAEGGGLLPLSEPHDPHQVAEALGTLGFNDVLVEGGARIHHAFLQADLYDRLEVYIATTTLGGGRAPAGMAGVPRIADGSGWRHEEPPRLLGTTVLLRLARTRA